MFLQLDTTSGKASLFKAAVPYAIQGRKETFRSIVINYFTRSSFLDLLFAVSSDQGLSDKNCLATQVTDNI